MKRSLFVPLLAALNGVTAVAEEVLPVERAEVAPSPEAGVSQPSALPSNVAPKAPPSDMAGRHGRHSPSGGCPGATEHLRGGGMGHGMMAHRQAMEERLQRIEERLTILQTMLEQR